jgi:hypothetical protein
MITPRAAISDINRRAAKPAGVGTLNCKRRGVQKQQGRLRTSGGLAFLGVVKPKPVWAPADEQKSRLGRPILNVTVITKARF